MAPAATLYAALDAFALSPTLASCPAIVYYDTSGPQISPSTTVTYSELSRLSLHAANFLSDIGVKRGDTLLLYAPNTPMWLAFFFASARLGAAAVALNTRFRESEMRHFIKTSGARVVILEDGFNKTDYVKVIVDSLEGSGVDKIRVVDVGAAGGRSSVKGVDVVKYKAPSAGEMAGLDELRKEPRMSQGTADDLSATFTTWVHLPGSLQRPY